MSRYSTKSQEDMWPEPPGPDVKTPVTALTPLSGRKKPVVLIARWGIYRSYQGEHPWALAGAVLDHPRFERNTDVTTSGILKPEASCLSELKDGDIVETENTLYKLVGNNVNGCSYER
jgi:hypothetical protein